MTSLAGPAWGQGPLLTACDADAMEVDRRLTPVDIRDAAVIAGTRPRTIGLGYRFHALRWQRHRSAMKLP